MGIMKLNEIRDGKDRRNKVKKQKNKKLSMKMLKNQIKGILNEATASDGVTPKPARSTTRRLKIGTVAGPRSSQKTSKTTPRPFSQKSKKTHNTKAPNNSNSKNNTISKNKQQKLNSPNVPQANSTDRDFVKNATSENPKSSISNSKSDDSDEDSRDIISTTPRVQMFPGMVARGAGRRRFGFPKIDRLSESRRSSRQNLIENPLFIEISRQIRFTQEGSVFPMRNVIGTIPQKNIFPKKKKKKLFSNDIQLNISDPSSNLPITNFVVDEIHPSSPDLPSTHLSPPFHDLPRVLTPPSKQPHKAPSPPDKPPPMLPVSFSIPESQPATRRLPLGLSFIARDLPAGIRTTPKPIIMAGPRQEQITLLTPIVDFEPKRIAQKAQMSPITERKLASRAFFIPERKLSPPLNEEQGVDSGS